MAFVTAPVIKDSNSFYPFYNSTDPFFTTEGNPTAIDVTAVDLGVEMIDATPQPTFPLPGAQIQVSARKLLISTGQYYWINETTKTWAQLVDALKIPWQL